MKTYIVYVDDYGTKCWHWNNKFHREDGPAVEYANGGKEWYLNGKRHREDGPAIEYADGRKLENKTNNKNAFDFQNQQYNNLKTMFDNAWIH